MPAHREKTGLQSPDFLPGSREMAGLIRAFDWSRTPIGPREHWPQSLRTLVDTLLAHPLPTVLLWGQDLIQIYNEGYARIAAGKHPAALGTPARQCWPELWPISVPICERVLQRAEPVLLEDQLLPITRRGEPKDARFTLTFSPVRNDEDSVAGVILTMIETTERGLAALQQERDRLSALVSSIGDEVWFADAAGMFTLINPAARRRFSLATDHAPDVERLAANLEVLRPDGSPRPVEEAPPLRALKGELITNEEEIIRVPESDQFRHRQVSATPVRDGAGQIIGSVSVVRDITKIKRAEEALKASRQMLETVVNHMPASVCVIRGSDLRLQLVNPAYQAIAPGMEMAGKTLDELWPEAGQDFATICRRVLETGEPYHVEDELNRIRRQPGGPVEPGYFSWSLHRVCLPGDEGWGLLNAAWETTARVRAEAALREAHEQLERRVEKRTAELRASEQSSARANRTLRALSAGNNALLRCSSEAELFREVCRIVVAAGGYQMAWIGLAEQDAKKTVRPLAQAGYVGSYPGKAQVTWADESRGQGPIGTAIRTGKPTLLRDLEHNPRFAPWRRAARRLGSASALGLPLAADGQCFGALGIFAAGPHAFDGEEVALLTQLANDLSYGITALRTRAARQRLEQQLLEVSAREQRRIGQELHDGVGQHIAAAKLMCSAIASQLAQEESPAAHDAARLERELAQAFEETRQIARGLHPVHPGPDSLMSALMELADSVTKLSRIPCRFSCRQPVLVPDDAVATHLYRIAQEAVNNAARHGRPTHIHIRLATANGSVRLQIEDDGCGLPVRPQPGSGLGLGIMRCRASVIGATIDIGPRRGGGTVVTCIWKAAGKESHAH